MTERENKSQLSGQRTRKRSTGELEVTVEMAKKSSSGKQPNEAVYGLVGSPKLCVQGYDPRRLSKDTER